MPLRYAVDMAVLIVVESCFGNTHLVAEAIAAGLSQAPDHAPVTLVRSDEAPQDIPADVDLLLVGAPTHEFSLPKESSRQQAVAKGATTNNPIGLRDWIGQVTPRADLRVITFDTSIKMAFSLGSASKAAFKALKKRGFRAAQRGQSFYVTQTAGPLADGEDQRAKAWGAQLNAPTRDAA